MIGSPVYLDFAATTPTDPDVIAAMRHSVDTGVAGANPSSNHVAGRRAAAAVDTARAQVADLIGTQPECIVWTSGATESDNLAIRGAALARANRGRHIVTMPTEHKAVVDTVQALEREGFAVTWIEPDENGLLSVESLGKALRPETQLVSIMHINNETGIIQDIEGLGRLCRERDVLFHCDAAQSVGKLPINLAEWPVDLLSLTAHKFYGPQGIGALFVAGTARHALMPLMFGGGQEGRLRPGTLPVHLIVGIGEAARVSAERQHSDLEHIKTLGDRLRAGISAVDDVIVSSPADNYPGILNVSPLGVEGESLMLALEPLCVASGSACNSTSSEPSYVLRALGRSDLEAQAAVRFSVGRPSTIEEIDLAIERFQSAVTRLRSIAPAA